MAVAGEPSAVRVHALIPAAGQGARMGASQPKQYLEICGKPVLVHAIEALARHPAISGVTVVLAPGDTRFEALEIHSAVPVDSVQGGATRAGSVMNGLAHISRQHQVEWVLVHDAVRPCLPQARLDDLLEVGLASPAGAILAVPVRDTLKQQGDDGCIEATVQREGLWAAQTPQLFPLAVLATALQAALDTGLSPTDDASVMEQAGQRPVLVSGSSANIKLTWPEDLDIASAWLSMQGMAE